MTAAASPPRIGVDAHYLGSRAGGNETHTRNLLEGLRTVAPDLDLRAFVNCGEDGAPVPACGWPVTPIPARSAYLRVPFALPWLARRHGLDLLHVQYTAPPFGARPYVVTMHDIVAFRLPESMPPLDRRRLRFFTARTLARAERIFTVTRAMRSEISEYFQIDPDCIDVTPNALARGLAPVEDPDRLAAVRRRYGIPAPYVLYLGLIQPRKNLARLARAFRMIVDKGYPHALVIAGKKAWLYEETLAEIAALNLGDRIVFTEYVAQEDLSALYSGADAFAFVSLYEGFGIPVIEALACGTPVLASTDPALMEVAGGGALHVDPCDVDAIAVGLEDLLDDADLRRELVGKGQAHARQYTPEAMARAAHTGYLRALEG